METITNATTAATNAILGNNESKQEPVSGEMGDVSKGEPYDAGNMGDPPEYGSVDQNPEQNASKKQDTTTGAHEVSPFPPIPASESKGTERRFPISTSKEHSEDSAPASAKDAGETAPASSSVGKGDGDQGKAATSDSVGENNKADDDGGSGADQEELGTGEKYIRSSGLKADGGDFDASNPGAGREADRLLEQKGIHREDAGHQEHNSEPGSANSESSGPKGAKKLKEKIKEKLHKDKGSSG